MKKLLTALSVVVFLLFFSFQFSDLNSQTNTFRLGYTGMYPHRFDYDQTKNVDWGWYGEHNINTWQGWFIGDKEKEVLGKLNANSLFGYFQPDTLRWLGYGKVVIHEAEITNINNNPVGRFRYNTHWCGQDYTDNTSFGGGKRVRYFNKNAPCADEDNPPGTILKDVNENGVHSVSGISNDPIYESVFPGRGSQYYFVNQWHIKPRMRIDSAIAFADPPLNVCRIVVRAFNGDIIKTDTLKTSNFLNESGQYMGQYIEDFYLHPIFVSADSINRGRSTNWQDFTQLANCQIDYEIYWYGEVSVWIDYVKVMDQPAENLLGSSLASENFRLRIHEKVDALLQEDSGNKMNGFYMEEIEYSQLTCVKFLQDYLQSEFPSAGNKVKMIALINEWSYLRNIKERDPIADYTEYIQKIQPPAFMFTGYMFWYADSPVDNYYEAYLPDSVSFSFPSHCPQEIQDQISASYPLIQRPYAQYTGRMQDTIFDRYVDSVRMFKTICDNNSIPFHLVPNICAITYADVQNMREPMNSELSAQICIGLCYGAKGVMPYAWDSYYAVYANEAPYYSQTREYQMGLADFDDLNPLYNTHKREHNYYGQNKWEDMNTLYGRIKTWSPVLANSTNTSGVSVSREGANFEFISDIISIDPYKEGQNSSCVNDYQTGDFITGPYFDCPEERYWEMGFFSTTEPNVKYLMMVNRRCVPEDGGYEGDDRVLRIKFDPTDLPGAVNWKIFDVLDSRTSVVFNKNSGNYITLGETNGGMGWFEPGEAKLFKLVPVLRSGGILVADEHISGQSFTCEDTVISNGYNITIDEGSVISFTDSATIIMNGGTFTSGGLGESSQPTTYKGVGSGKWNGLRFNGTDVKIYNSKFQDIASPCVNYAISMVDCQFADIRTNQFVLNTDTAGAIQSVYIEDPFGSPSYTGLHINYNSITMANSRGNAIAVQGFSGITLPLYAGNNTMTSNGYATGILLSTITGGVVKNNSITGFSTGINTLLSTIDVYGNTISNTSSQSKGIIATGLSSSGLLPASGLWLGGMNSIINTSGASTNIEVNNSVFALEGGNNTFDVTSTSGAYHLYGTFWDSSYNNKQRYNCFKLGGSTITSPTNPNYFISIGFATLTLNFTDYTCNATPPEDVTVVDLGNGLYDTIPYSGGGEMGSNYKTTPSAPQAGGHPSLVHCTLFGRQ